MSRAEQISSKICLMEWNGELVSKLKIAIAIAWLRATKDHVKLALNATHVLAASTFYMYIRFFNTRFY